MLMDSGVKGKMAGNKLSPVELVSRAIITQDELHFEVRIVEVGV